MSKKFHFEPRLLGRAVYIYLLAEGLDADTLSKLYSKFLPDFLLFGYDITPLEEMIKRKIKEVAI